MQHVEIIGAKKHNLKNIGLKIPKRQLVCITGVSGSGKSTLAFDTLFQEGQRKYLETLSVYARQFIKTLEKPEVQAIRGISPTISIDQKHASFYYNSTVGTISGISHYLRLLYARAGEARCPECGKTITNCSIQKVAEYIFQRFSGRAVQVFAPVVKNRKGAHKALLEKYLKRGFLKALIDGELYYLDEDPELNRAANHTIAILIDAVKATEQNRKQVEESVALASFESRGEIVIKHGAEEHFFSDKLYCPDCNISIREPQPATFSLNSPAAVCPTCKGRGTNAAETGEADRQCVSCEGSGFNRWALSFYFRGRTIFQAGEMEIADLLKFFKGVVLSADENVLLASIFPQLIQRLESFVTLNLGYMTLNRKINTLSGGELQRARLVSQIGFSLSGIIYILDEPSIGMHMSEQQNLIGILKKLIENDNTVMVVEHDLMTISASDFIVDLGPGAGESGGYLTYCGPYSEFEKARGSLTSDYVFNRKSVNTEKSYLPAKGTEPVFLEVGEIYINNIKNETARIPLEALTVVTGVSGSGKSSLIIDAVYPIIQTELEKRKHKADTETRELDKNFRGGSRGAAFLKGAPLAAGGSKTKGIENVQRIMMVTQSAVGKNSRSCPATYIGIMPMIRELFAGLAEAKIRGYGSRRFSFNVPGGRCEACKGMGYRKLEMSFLPELEVPCPVCGGKRYNSETLMVKYNGLSIADVLELTAAEAYTLFRNIPLLAKKINVLLEVGLGYLKLGQSSVTLSGGESQRIKLTRELSRISTKPAVYLMDEPTIGLHFDDIRKLLEVFGGLIVRGNTVVVIEHNLEIIKAADYIIDLGPGGGRHGGRIIYQGEAGGLVNASESVTAKYLSR